MDTSESGLSLASRVNHEWTRLSKTERVVARYLVAAPPQRVMLATAGDIGRATGASDATVVRTARRLGYAGLPDLKAALGAHLTTVATGAPQISERLQLARSAGDLSATAARVVADVRDRVAELGRKTDPAALGRALQLIAPASTVFCYGWGVNELSARYLALKLNRAGKFAVSSGATGFTLADDLLALSSHHAVVIFAPGRVLPELRLLVAHARAAGAGLILVTENLGEEITGAVDVVLRDEASPGGLTAEPIGGLLIADMLVLATMAAGRDPALDTYELLTRLRRELAGDA
ncbi:MurR/RpiR family transcriptional regulator [Amycolatopsis sp. NPDC051903]|uniref:MurR/RpiR family transcriptional regulator n=1 Tax=Amycolatopsis sp. NPDC051903 TaxID=3363936 RepID=UPI00378C4345